MAEDQAPTPSRDELVALVAKAHADAPYAEATATGRALAAQSRLPGKVAENLGAGFGQWDFFPEAAEIVDFALAYVPPANEEEVMALARTWATDDAASKHTLMALVGRDILRHEVRRVDVPKIKELVEETRETRALELRRSLGLPAPASSPAKAERKPRPRAATAVGPARNPEVMMKMPKPVFVPPKKKEAPAPARRFTHPKFGEGPLEKIEGTGEEAKLTIKFPGGSKTLLAKFVSEVATTNEPPAS